MHAEPRALDNEDVASLLDILFADREWGAEPDWAAIETKLFVCQGSLYSVARDLLRAVWAIYEDESAFDTALWKVQNLP